MVKEKAPDKKILVVQMEMFFNINEDDISDIAEAVYESLEKMREQAGARVIGSYADHDSAEFRNRAVDSIEIPAPTKLLVDRDF
jgi:hypothetical protein